MNYRNIVILTGAGVSKESGLSTFRDNDGLWENHRVEEVATPEAYHRDPEFVHRFYNMRRANLKTVKPNKAHNALARLEREWKGQVYLITQNVDDLHERAGNTHLCHMHGELLKARCTACRIVRPWFDDMTTASVCPKCESIGTLRPHIVWFGEMPFFMDDIEAALNECDLFISIGTSGNVYPAAGFVAQVSSYGRAHTVEINLEPSEGANLFKQKLHGEAGILVPQFVDELLRGQNAKAP